MLKELSKNLREIANEEEKNLLNVLDSILDSQKNKTLNPRLEEEIMQVRDQISEAHPDDLASLVAHLTRLISLRERVEVQGVNTKPISVKNPYFAHLTLVQDPVVSIHSSSTEKEIREIFLGKRFYSDPGRKFVIVDWRDAPIAKIYYKHQENDSYEEVTPYQVNKGLVLAKRAVVIQNSILESIQGEGYQLLKNEDGEWEENLQISKYELSGGTYRAFRTPAGRLGVKGKYHLPEITALIDPQQFESISQENSGVMIIQGGAGTGKTTIALHRIAYLNYQNPKKFKASKILMITPGQALKNYITDVLPALGFNGVKIESIGDWAFKSVQKIIKYSSRFSLMEENQPFAQKIKRHPLLIKYIEKYIENKGKALEEKIQEFSSSHLQAWVARRNLPLVQRIKQFKDYLKQKQALNQELIKYLTQYHEDLEDMIETWYVMLTDGKNLKKLFQHQTQQGDDPVNELEIDFLINQIREQYRKGIRYDQYHEDYRMGADGQVMSSTSGNESKLDIDDCMILLKICQLLYGRLQSFEFPEEKDDDVGFDGYTEEDEWDEENQNIAKEETLSIRVISYEHIVVDEAQDLSPLTLQILCDIPPPNSPITLAGDTAQRVIFNNGFSQWEEVLPFLPKNTHILPPLLVSYRSTRQILDLSKHVLGGLDNQWETRDAREGARVELFKFKEKGQSVAFLADALNRLFEAEYEATVALIAKTPKIADFYFEGLLKAKVPKLRRVEEQNFPFISGVDVTDIYQVKGLEFDYVILLETTTQYYTDCKEDRHLLHVGMTRSAHQLWMICTGQPSTLLPKNLVENGYFDGNEPTVREQE
jgi:DNA helicase-2/ATP-dependent DNA helicase PcrA